MKTMKFEWFHFQRIELNITQKKDANLQRTVPVRCREYLSALQQETQKHGKKPVYT